MGSNTKADAKTRGLTVLRLLPPIVGVIGGVVIVVQSLNLLDFVVQVLGLAAGVLIVLVSFLAWANVMSYEDN